MDWPPDKYDGTLVLPGAAPAESLTLDGVATAIEALYEREPKLTRNLLERLRAASTEDLEALFKS
jgi:hypothetical protein